MNCPIRTDPAPDEGHNQNPSDLANEINTNNSLSHRRNSTRGRDGRIHLDSGSQGSLEQEQLQDTQEPGLYLEGKAVQDKSPIAGGAGNGGGGIARSRFSNGMHKLKRGALKYFKFMGPGLMVSVAYIDPGNSSHFPKVAKNMN
jgi:hypothetical protein